MVYYTQPLAVAIISLQMICDLTIPASMVHYLYTQCTRVKQWVSPHVVFAPCADDSFAAQDNHHSCNTRTLLHYQWGPCAVRHLIAVPDTLF